MSRELENLNEEARLLRDQINENPKLVSASADIEQFKLDLARLKKESGNSEESFCALYKSNLEFIEELKDYMDYNEEQRIERRQNDVEEYDKKIELLDEQLHQSEGQTEGYKELLCSTQCEYEAKINEIEDELKQVKNEIREQKEKEITELKERLVREESAKSEIHAKHQNLYEEKVSLNNEKLNIEKLFEQMKTQFSSKETDYTKTILKLNSEIGDFKEKVDSMKNSLELKQDKIKFLEEIKKTKDKLVEDKKQLQSEIQQLQIEVR
jgi:ribosomal protein L17